MTVNEILEAIAKHNEQLRKETAKEFAFMLESRLAYYNEEDSFTKIEILTEIKELLKEIFNVEVE